MEDLHTENAALARLVVLISGSGTNLQAILDAIHAGQLAAEVVLVLSNRKYAYGLVRAERAGIPTLHLPIEPFLKTGAGRAGYDTALAEQVRSYRPDLIVMVGWMHILSEAFLNHFAGRVLNLHPALPGAFPGRDAIQRAYESYQQGQIDQSGCMVHYAVPEVDAGPVVRQRVVPFLPDDTLERFEARMHEAEHRLIVEALQTVLQQKASPPQ